MRVLLLGCGGNAGINYVRCLKMGDPTIEVYGLDTSLTAALASNVDGFQVALPFAFDDPEKAHYIEQVVEDWNIDFVHAQPDSLARLLFEYQWKLPVTKGSVEEWDNFSDKLYCQQVWRDNDIGVMTFSLDEAFMWWPEILAESGKAWIRASTGAGSKCALPVTSRKQAENWAQYWIEREGMKITDFMVSEYLPGSEYAVQMFFVDGELRQAQARERVEYFFGNIMPSGQSSTPSVARTVNDVNAYDIALRAVRCISKRPHGIYGVDMKARKNGKLVPTEVNYGRYYTTSNFFAELGMNTPYDELMLYRSKEMPIMVDKIPENYYWMRGLDKLPVIRTPNGTIQKTTA